MRPTLAGAVSSTPLTETQRVVRFIKFNPCFILALIAVSVAVSTSREGNHSPEFDRTKPVEVTGWVSTPVTVRNHFSSYELTPVQLRQGEHTFSINGNLQVFLPGTPETGNRKGDSGPSLHYGEMIRFNSYLGEPSFYSTPGAQDSRRSAKLRGVPFRVHLKSLLQIERTGRYEGFVVTIQAPLRRYLNRFEAHCFEALSPAAARLVLSSFLGRSFYLQDTERERAQNLGVQHLFVVSGFHVAVVLAALHGLLRSAGIPGRLLTILSAWAYISGVGFTVPATRAGIIATVYYVALTLGLSTRSLNTLGFSALLVILTTRDAVFLSSFQFSYACILSIVLIACPLMIRFGSIKRGVRNCFSGQVLTGRSEESILERRSRYITESFAAFLPRESVTVLRLLGSVNYYVGCLIVISISIQLILLPLVLQNSNRWSLLQPFSNLLLVPLFSVILPLTFSLMLIYWTPLAVLPAYLLRLSAATVSSLMNLLDAVNSPIHLSQPSVPGLAGFYCLLIILFIGLPRKAKSAVLILSLLLLALLTQTPGRALGLLQITMLDVGQGESIHIRYPDGTDALIDTGGSKLAVRQSLVSERVVARYLWRIGVRRLHYLLISHPETDHRGGYKFISSAFPVDQLLHFEDHPDYEGSGLQLSKSDQFQQAGVWHGVIHPPRNAKADNSNVLSLVILLRYGHFSALFTGDIGEQEERETLSSLPPLTLLKIAHHGSRTSTSPDLLERTSPQVAMISAGRRNAFGHPAKDVLERIKKAGAVAVSTASLGTLRIVTDGFEWQLQYFCPDKETYLTASKGTALRIQHHSTSEQRAN